MTGKYNPLPVEVDVYAYIYDSNPDIVALEKVENELPYNKKYIQKVATESKILVNTGSGGWIGIINDTTVDFHDALGQFRYAFPFSIECERCGKEIEARKKAYRVRDWSNSLYCGGCYSLKVLADI